MGVELNTDRRTMELSLTCALCKYLENIVRRQMCEHLVLHNAISATRHGVIVGKSYLANLLPLDEGQPVEASCMDFCKNLTHFAGYLYHSVDS